jgi:hypothetical protein
METAAPRAIENCHAGKIARSSTIHHRTDARRVMTSYMRLVAVAALAIGCARPATPTSFSAGDRWTFSLVDPLDDGRLLVPVVVGGGLHVFALDPEAPRTVVDREVVPANAAAACDGSSTGSLLDARDGSCPPRAAPLSEDVELATVRIGELTVERLRVHVVAPHALDTRDRRIAGIIGRDVLQPGLVFGFDRDRGVAWLATRRVFRPPTPARTIALDEPIRVAEREAHGSIDLGRVESRIANGTVASKITFGGITRTQFPVAPADSTGEPRLGLGFFRAFAVALDRTAGRLYLSARDGSPQARTARLARWGAAWPRCANPGCVRLTLAGGDLTVSPETPSAPLQVVVRATTPTGERLPDVELALPAGARQVSAELGDRYEGAVLEVIDASPFPRKCSGADACLIRSG